MNIKLHKGALKLAGLYLAILMFISVCFSANIYQLSVQEFNRGLRGSEPRNLINHLPDDYWIGKSSLDEAFENRYNEATTRVLRRLLVINALILLGGGALCYALALWTLKPIEEAHEAQNRFTADASHELRTPITAMRTENEVTLMDPKLTLAQAKTQLSSNIEELEKLTALSEGLLQLSTHNHQPPKKLKLYVRNLVEDAVKKLDHIVQVKDITIKRVLPKQLEVVGDKDQLVQCLIILLDNAIKYSPPGTIVTITANKDSKNISIAIQDQGMGIKSKDLPHIFERFYRSDNARSKDDSGGYGLGLSIAKNFAKLHNGDLKVTSRPNKGSTFSLVLPRE